MMQFEKKEAMEDKESKGESRDFKKQEVSEEMEELAAMEKNESGKIDSTDIKKQEILEELAAMEENCAEKNVNSGSVIDVSGKELDCPLIDSKETAVEEVFMYKNELYLIPRPVGRFKGLKTLKYFANEVNLFPREFRNLVDLECLQVEVTPPGINGLELSKLKNLKELELSRVPPRPSAFPILSEIAGLKRLTRLSVCHFSIRYLPKEIDCLSNLKYLDLSFNKLKNLPDEITSLDLLISLKVTNNKLIELPKLSYLQRLEYLDLSNNRLISLGCLELESMRKLQILNLQHNQLSRCHIPSWIHCNVEGNHMELSNDDSSEMDVYEGSSVAPSGHLNRLPAKKPCLAARREKGWKRRYNLQTKSQKEMINCKKWKSDATTRISSDKCMTCRESMKSDNALTESLSIVEDADLDSRDIFPEGANGSSILSRRNEKFITSEESENVCSCSAIYSDEMRKKVKAYGPECDPILDSLSEVAKVVDETSSSEPSGVLKSKRHLENDLDNPKPTKTRRPTSDPSLLSCQYSKRSFCGVEDLLPDGFYDAGRDRPFMPLDSYEENPHPNSREVILLDREKDEELDAILLRARALVYHFNGMNSSICEDNDFTAGNLHIASLLALFVSDHFGGSDKSAVIHKTRKSVSGSNYKKPFVCTCATGISGDTNKTTKQDVDTFEDVALLDICEKFLQSIRERRDSVIVPLGGIHFGVCRHRALLMKYLCDRMEPRIPCELIRGYLDFSPHAWNVIVIKRGESTVRILVDACHPHDIREESDPEYFTRYIPLNRMIASHVDHDGNPNCLFPSLSACDKIGNIASTSLMRCNVGSLVAAVKVRTIDSNEASAHEIRNFELCCLGEVRMLSALKHSCIVEFFGHQISSKWSFTTDGYAEGRTLRSAIVMEYMKGGSLKNYIEKLSSAGDKHVALNLVIPIARDVAFALTELHSKHIIHRDIKSENILIDIENKKQDGSPVVKICDFDRAIPLHSYLHTCSIAHVGIPPPDMCVGTPRWMAPEVFRAMQEQNLYGLEVDIWSFGCLLLELLTLQVPYSGLPDSEIHELLQMGERPKLTEELEALCQSGGEFETELETLTFLAKLYHRCTEKNPTDRPSAESIYKWLLDHSSSTTDSRSPEQD